MNTRNIQLTNTNGKVAVAYDHIPLVTELGIGIPLDHRWRWSFDGSLHVVSSAEQPGRDQLGDYSVLALTYNDQDGPLVQQRLKVYQAESYPPPHPPLGKGGPGEVLITETTALRDLPGAALEDSFFHTTFNSPVVCFAD